MGIDPVPVYPEAIKKEASVLFYEIQIWERILGQMF